VITHCWYKQNLSQCTDLFSKRNYVSANQACCSYTTKQRKIFTSNRQHGKVSNITHAEARNLWYQQGMDNVSHDDSDDDDDDDNTNNTRPIPNAREVYQWRMCYVSVVGSTQYIHYIQPTTHINTHTPEWVTHQNTSYNNQQKAVHKTNITMTTGCRNWEMN